MNEDIRSSVFGNISLAKIFSLRYSEFFHERRSLVFGIRKIFKNEDLRSSCSENFHERRSSVFGIWKFFKNEDLRYSVFGIFLRTKIFGLRYSVNFTLRCNSGH